MKTLKQFLQENIELVHYFRETETVLENVEEWLLQNFKEYQEKMKRCNFESNKQSHFYKAEAIQELVKELR
jgi:hypothetical protein